MGVMGKPLRSPTPKGAVTEGGALGGATPYKSRFVGLYTWFGSGVIILISKIALLLNKDFLRRHPVGVPLSEMGFAMGSAFD